jgi:hypothetical protein
MHESLGFREILNLQTRVRFPYPLPTLSRYLVLFPAVAACAREVLETVYITLCGTVAARTLFDSTLEK